MLTGEPCAGSAAGGPWAAHFPGAHLHQVWRHKTPAAHHVEQGPRFALHDPQHGVPQAEQVEGTFSVLGGFHFSYRKVRP